MASNAGMKVTSLAAKLMFHRGNSSYNSEVFFAINNYYMYIHSFHKTLVSESFNQISTN